MKNCIKIDKKESSFCCDFRYAVHIIVQQTFTFHFQMTYQINYDAFLNSLYGEVHRCEHYIESKFKFFIEASFEYSSKSIK
jgi:hypothetical protein